MRSLDDRSIRELARVHPQLSAIVLRAHCLYTEAHPGFRFRVTSGYRTQAEQDRLFAAGVTPTRNSYHTEGVAVDLAVLDASASVAYWEQHRYVVLNAFMVKAAAELGLGEHDLTWGGNWRSRDAVHWQLERQWIA